MSEPTLPPGYTPNEKIRARLAGVTSRKVRFIVVAFRQKRSCWQGKLKITDRSAIEEILNAFKTSSRPSHEREDIQQIKLVYDRFTFHVGRWWARDRIIPFRIYSLRRWGPSVEAIYQKYRPDKEAEPENAITSVLD